MLRAAPTARADPAWPGRLPVEDVERLFAAYATGRASDDPAARATARDARDRLVVSNHTLVRWRIPRFLGRGLDGDDLFQEGVIGLMRGVDRFDPRRGCAPATYLVAWIDQAMGRACANQGLLVRLPVELGGAGRAIRAGERALLDATGVPPTDAQLADRLGIPEGRVARHRRGQRVQPRSLDRPGDGDGDGDERGDRRLPAPGEGVEDLALRAELRAVVARRVAAIGARRAALVRLRFGLDDDGDELAPAAIARAIGCSRQRVAQLLADALARLGADATLRALHDDRDPRVPGNDS